MRLLANSVAGLEALPLELANSVNYDLIPTTHHIPSLRGDSLPPKQHLHSLAPPARTGVRVFSQYGIASQRTLAMTVEICKGALYVRKASDCQSCTPTR